MEPNENVTPIPVGEQDVTPIPMRIHNARNELHELQLAAERGELDDWATVELGNMAEQAVNVWRIAIRKMVVRMSAD